jgi:glyoxylase-like metal-dependent hydrolase (beta-lactamase superfamily II)
MASDCIKWSGIQKSMKIINLTEDSKIYTSNAYLVLGTWNALADMNTLVDVGRDSMIIDKINNINTGVGKRRIDQVILTHNHYDHVGLLPLIREFFNPKIYGFSSHIEGIDQILKSGDTMRIGDRDFEVFHAPGHSSDSILLYCKEEGVLFNGDVSLAIRAIGGTYDPLFKDILGFLIHENIKAIYMGHGKPMLEGCNRVINETYKNVMREMIDSGDNKIRNESTIINSNAR